MVWQSAAFAYFGSPGAVRFDPNHDRMHLELQAHHHDADGSLEFDDSVASLLHMLADAGSTTTLVPVSTVTMPSIAAIAPRPAVTEVPPTVYLDGPIRPPRPTV